MRHSLVILLVASLVNSLPLGLLASSPEQLLSWQHTLKMQQPFQPTPDSNPKHTSGQHLEERRPRSVEMLLTTEDDEEVVHVWLPLGERIYTRTCRNENSTWRTRLTRCRRLPYPPSASSNSAYNQSPYASKR